MIFPTSLALPIRKLLQEKEVEPDDLQRRINHLIHVQKMREWVYNRSQFHQDRMNKTFYKHSKQEEFQVEDLVLKWDVRNEDKGRQKKINHLWTGPFIICAYRRNNTYMLEELNGESTGWGPLNDMFLKHYLVQ
jgi:hypothetical protein